MALPMIMGRDQNAAIFGYVHAGYVIMYSQYWTPLYYLQYQPHEPCHDDSWILNAQEEDEHNESLILNAQEEEEDDDDDEIELSEDELREWDLLDGELVFYDASDDHDNGLSEEMITKHMKTRDCNDHVDSDRICVVCQDCLLDEDEKIIATLDCGHDFHVGCIKNWLMLKNSCPLCKATGIRL